MFVKITNQDRKTELGRAVEVAVTARARSRGLLGSNGWEGRDGMLLSPCRNVHTFGMRYSIDVALLDREGRVVKVVAGLRPGRVSDGAVVRPSGSGERKKEIPISWLDQTMREIPCTVT